MQLNTTLTDGSVTLRQMQLSDSPIIFEAVLESLTDLEPWMSWAHDGYSVEENLNWLESQPKGWEEGTDYTFAIIDACDGSYIGGCGITHINPAYRLANLGYWVRSGRRGQGFAGRAARLAARFGFEQLNLIRAEIVVAAGNTASLRVAEKAGAKREGTLRNRMVVREAVYDAVMHSLIPQDFGLEL
jgi:ribosomal-protein-serine acetyltransferase